VELTDIQVEVMRRHGVRVPITDPSFVVVTINGIMLAEERARFAAQAKVEADRIEAAVSKVAPVTAAISEEDITRLEQTLARGVPGQVGRIVRAIDWRNRLVGVGLLFAALLIGAGGGYWFHGEQPALVSVRAGADRCEDRADGSRLCWIPVLERLPRNTPPPAPPH